MWFCGDINLFVAANGGSGAACVAACGGSGGGVCGGAWRHSSGYADGFLRSSVSLRMIVYL